MENHVGQGNSFTDEADEFNGHRNGCRWNQDGLRV